jgi:hypothetical protein
VSDGVLYTALSGIRSGFCSFMAGSPSAFYTLDQDFFCCCYPRVVLPHALLEAGFEP